MRAIVLGQALMARSQFYPARGSEVFIELKDMLVCRAIAEINTKIIQARADIITTIL